MADSLKTRRRYRSIPRRSLCCSVPPSPTGPRWKPAIFGTLLERALNPQDRHKLGAHYTPRSYVERLVKPTIIDPLRAKWDNVKKAAAQLLGEGEDKQACDTVRDYHRYLCQIRVLDPACGSGNFLYVTPGAHEAPRRGGVGATRLARGYRAHL